MNIVMITGASSGIGWEFARQMDASFNTIDEFWLIARREDKLRELSGHLRHKTRIIPMDITDEEALVELIKLVMKKRAVIRMLINCAGYGIMGNFAKSGSISELGMIRLNCEALTSMTHKMLPFMRKGSRIIQLASSAAFLPQPNFAVYAATKSYVLSFSRALGEELSGRGIIVTSVCPGPVDTPFFEIAEKGGETLFIKKFFLVPASRVVASALHDSYLKRSLSVCSLPIKCFGLITKVIPHGILLRIMRCLK